MGQGRNGETLSETQKGISPVRHEFRVLLNGGGSPRGDAYWRRKLVARGGRAGSLHVEWTRSVDFTQLRWPHLPKGRPCSRVLPTPTHAPLTVTSERDTVPAPTLHLRKPMNREARQPAQGHTASKRQSGFGTQAIWLQPLNQGDGAEDASTWAREEAKLSWQPRRVRPVGSGPGAPLSPSGWGNCKAPPGTAAAARRRGLPGQREQLGAGAGQRQPHTVSSLHPGPSPITASPQPPGRALK